jgi:hypothetical protein
MCMTKRNRESAVSESYCERQASTEQDLNRILWYFLGGTDILVVIYAIHEIYATLGR